MARGQAGNRMLMSKREEKKEEKKSLRETTRMDERIYNSSRSQDLVDTTSPQAAAVPLLTRTQSRRGGREVGWFVASKTK